MVRNQALATVFCPILISTALFISYYGFMVFLCENMMILLKYRRGYTSAVSAFTRFPSYSVTQPCTWWLLFVWFGISLKLQTHWVHLCFQAHLPCSSLTFGTLCWLPSVARSSPDYPKALLLALVQISYLPRDGSLSHCWDGFSPTVTILLSQDSELIKMFYILHLNSVYLFIVWYI